MREVMGKIQRTSERRKTPRFVLLFLLHLDRSLGTPVLLFGFSYLQAWKREDPKEEGVRMGARWGLKVIESYRQPYTGTWPANASTIRPKRPCTVRFCDKVVS
jgi:hypothetical protein